MTNSHQTRHCFSLFPHQIVANGAMPADEEKTFRVQNDAYRMICATEAVFSFGWTRSLLRRASKRRQREFGETS